MAGAGWAAGAAPAGGTLAADAARAASTGLWYTVTFCPGASTWPPVATTRMPGARPAAQLALLRRWNCDAYQGYLCSRPLPADEMTQLLRQLRATRQVSLAGL